MVSAYWPALLPAALAGIALYLLLPRARPYPKLLAALASAAAVISVGMFLIRNEFALVEGLLFYVFAGLAVLFAGLMLSQTNPVHAALSFAMVVLSTCGLFLLQGAPFLMAGTIIVYAGAIVVTFLFVIMLAQQEGLSSADARSREPFLATAAGAVLLASLLCVQMKSYSALDPYFAKVEDAAKTKDVAQWQAILGKDGKFFTDFRQAVLPVRQGRQVDSTSLNELTRKQLADAIDEASPLWNGIRPGDDGKPREARPELVEQFTAKLEEIRTLGRFVRDGQGSLQPSVNLPLSEFGGLPANRPRSRNKDGKVEEQLPAANVAGLGKTLFTDHLLAVELAGTLLLVAAIGAIAIAGRRTEGLR